jgi:acetyltransferase-like isoleucine patch superfamily enzyme
MASLYRQLALGQNPLLRLARKFYWGLFSFSIPVPRAMVVIPARIFVAARMLFYSLMRALIAEPYFRSYCTRVGKDFHTGPLLHWVEGDGRILLGDHVSLTGRSNFFFALRYSEAPTLEIGDFCGFGHNCSFVVGKRIEFGKHCRIASNVTFFDTPGHPLDPEVRRTGAPARDEEVKPIVIRDNVWIGTNSTIFPGVEIGENSVVAYGSVVMTNVPANVVVAGNPARQITKLTTAEASGKTSQ